MLNTRKAQKKAFYLAALMAFGLFFVPTHSANAFELFGIGSFAYGAVASIFAYTTFLMFSLIGSFISVLAEGLYYVINIPVYPDGGLAVVDESWKLMRNFANMFFIVALIIMSFATIFNITKYEARTLFPKFLIAALLINFSLVIGVLVIDASQVLSNTFLTAIGDISGRLGETMNPSQLLPSSTEIENMANAANAGEQLIFGTVIRLVFSVVLLFTMLFSLLTAFLFAIIRIPILWALLVVSPIAWILSILPTTQGTYKKWWSLFIGWNLFLPFFLFFLYFGLLFLQSQDQVTAAIASQTKDELLIGGGFTIQTIFFYVLAAIFLIGGTITAMKAALFSGTGVVGVAKWSRGVAARRLGLTAAGAAAKQRLGQIQEEGLPGKAGIFYGGKFGLEQQTGRFAQRFGVRGAEIKTQKAFVDLAGKNYQDFEREYQNGRINESEVVKRANQFDATDPRGLAYRKLAAKIGQLDTDGKIFTTTLQQLSNNPLAAEDFVKSAKDGKFSKMKGPDLARMAAAEKGTDPKTGIPYDYSFLKGSVAARREMFRYVQSDTKAASSLSKDQFEAGLGVFGGHTTAEGRSYIKEMSKVSPDFVANYKLRTPDLKKEEETGFEKAYGTLPTGTPPEQEFQLRTHMLGGALKTGDIKNTSSLRLDVWKTPEFKEAMKLYVDKLRNKARTSYINRLERALIDSQGGDQKIEILYNDVLGAGYARTGASRSPVPPSSPTGRLS